MIWQTKSSKQGANKMLSTYNDAHLFNESLAYYMSTNYFRNPLYEGEDALTSAHYQPQGSSDSSSSSSSRSQGDEQNTYVQSGHKANKRRVRIKFEKNKQRFNNFCDNLTLNFKGKLFVMELNFKRRLNLMRKYLSRTMPWILPSSARDHQGRTMAKGGMQEGDCNQENNNEHYANYNLDQALNYSINNGKLAYIDDELEQKSFWTNLRPPKSSDSLGEQQAKILTRLLRVKVVNKKLFSRDDPNNNLELDAGCYPAGQLSPNDLDEKRQIPISNHSGHYHAPSDCSALGSVPFTRSGLTNGVYYKDFDAGRRETHPLGENSHRLGQGPSSSSSSFDLRKEAPKQHKSTLAASSYRVSHPTAFQTSLPLINPIALNCTKSVSFWVLASVCLSGTSSKQNLFQYSRCGSLEFVDYVWRHSRVYKFHWCEEFKPGVLSKA